MTSPERVYARRWWILLVLCLSLVVITLDNTILNVALPTLVRDLDATNSQLQWIVDSYTLVFAGLLLSAGALGDRFGRKGALQIGLGIFALGSILAALATTPDQLIITRAIMGIGGAFIMPATLSILTNVFPAEERGRAIGVWAGVSGIGIAVGPLLGGFLIEHFSWHAIFTVNIPIAAVAIIAGGFLVPTSKDPSAPRLDPVGAGLSIVGLVALVYSLIEAPDAGWTDPKILAGFAVGLFVLVAFAWWELRSTHPMLDVSVFSNPRFSAASTAITLVFFAMFGFSFLLTQYFQFVLGYTALETGIRLLPLALTIMVVAPLSSRLVERFGTKAVVTTGMSFVAIALALNVGLQTDSAYIQVMWRMMLLALGMALTMAPATESIMGSLPLAKAGVGSAVNDTTRQIGGALGVAIVGSVLSSVYGSKITDFFQDKSVPAEAVEAAKGSLGGALRVAGGGGPLGDSLRIAAQDGFVSALHLAALVAAVAAALGAVVTAIYLPARARTADVTSQNAEYDAELEIAAAEGADLEVVAGVVKPEVAPAPHADEPAVPRPARGRPRDPELDAEILAASAAIVAECGLDCLTMDAVARKAGVAKATIYRRFPGKIDLIAATCGVVAPPLPEAPDTGDIRTDLIEIMGGVVAMFRETDGGRMMPSMVAASATNPDVREALSRFSSTRRSRVAQVLRRAVARGELVDSIDVDTVVDQLVGAVLYRFLVTGRSLSPAFQEKLVDQVLCGTRARD